MGSAGELVHSYIRSVVLSDSFVYDCEMDLPCTCILEKAGMSWTLGFLRSRLDVIPGQLMPMSVFV